MTSRALPIDAALSDAGAPRKPAAATNRAFAQPLKPFKLLRWFALLSLVAIALTSSLSAYVLFRFLSDHLLERDARVSLEFIQSVAQINDPAAYFHGSDEPNDRAQLEKLFRYITLMPDVLRANVYRQDQTVIWSSDAELIGRRFGDNPDLTQALTGRLAFHRERRGDDHKTEHAVLPAHVEDFLESYVPIWDQQRRRVLGVVEIYKAPTALFRALRQGQWLVVGVSALSGAALYLALFWIVRRATRVMARQQQALSEAEKLTLVGELTSSVTHNLRNPLAAIRSSAELSLEDLRGPDREPIGDIIDEVDRLDRWVRELLVISHDDSTTVRSASLAQVIDAALQQAGPRLAKQGVRVRRQLAEELPPALANPDALIQVLISLINNASEAMPGGGSLSLQAEPAAGRTLLLRISDTGTGIDENRQSDLFQSLVSHKPGGLGIGLPLARRVIQRYGGSLALSSQPRQGTTVTIQLSVAP